SFAALWGAWRHRRWLFWVMLPLVLCMCVSTVWGRYHYVADIFGGMITGTLGYVLGKWLMRRGTGRFIVTFPVGDDGRETHEFSRMHARFEAGTFLAKTGR